MSTAISNGSRLVLDDQTLVERGRRVLRMEAEALQETDRRLGDEFARAVRLIADSSGRVIVAGVGKSGLIGRKIAATLTSTGTPATFLHPVESLHGDLGIVGENDAAILISKSGASDELLGMLEHLQRLGVATISITGNRDSQLARLTDVALDGWVSEEACPHDLAPTTSSTVALALGDALAVALLEAKGFRREDFARLHPGGTLGRKLLTRVSDVMLRDSLPLLPPDASMRQAVVELARRRGIVVVVDEQRRCLGVLTTGDLTRLMERQEDFMDIPVREIMTRGGQRARPEELASAVVYRMEQRGIISMPVLDDSETVVGVIHLHDIMRAGVS
jgi:arabinose-5-phosphate isomerase